jgi:hypothetical protein
VFKGRGVGISERIESNVAGVGTPCSAMRCGMLAKSNSNPYRAVRFG